MSKLPEKVKNIVKQALNRSQTWSVSQQPKSEIVNDLRFTGIDLSLQPNPAAAIELLKEQPAIHVNGRKVSCDGGGDLGHPKVYINLVYLSNNRTRTIVVNTADKGLFKHTENKFKASLSSNKHLRHPHNIWIQFL